MSAAAAGQTAHRRLSIDILRGLVLLLMALDYYRDFFGNASFSPTDLEVTTSAYFVTRWITHICAPAFALLAGMSAMIQLGDGRSRKDVSLYLLRRGILLIFLEITIVTFGWNFSFDAPVLLQILFALGGGMILLAGLVWLPPVVSIGVAGGLMLVQGVDLFGIGGAAEILPRKSGLWIILLGLGEFKFAGVQFLCIYPVLPWFSAMALGFGLGGLYFRERSERVRAFALLGGAFLLLFLVLRGLNSYGNLYPWTPQDSTLWAVFSFLNVEKFPPSLVFLLVTLGLVLLLLAWLEQARPAPLGVLAECGAVPLFFYVVHIYLGHISVVTLGILQGYGADEMIGPLWALPMDYGFSLGMIYVFWLILMAVMIPLCRFYGAARHAPDRPRILKYL